ncbi:MAG: ATP-binding protein [Lachnospiraceae bacterium]|nr:ATP-binding protein [Lachnospiraceae bacterium]
MQRKIMEDLYQWYKCEDKKILILKGTFGCGKTWAVNELVKNIDMKIPIYDDVNSENDIEETLRKAYENCDTKSIIITSIVVSDLYEKIPIYYEWVSILEMYPLSFAEFCDALTDIDVEHNIGSFNLYMMIGGMPEMVSYLASAGNKALIYERHIDMLKRILRKIAGEDKTFYSKLWDICLWAAKYEPEDTSGFCLTAINRHARGRDYGTAMDTLIKYGILLKIGRFDHITDRINKNYRLVFGNTGFAIAMKINRENELYLWENHLSEMVITSYIIVDIYRKFGRDKWIVEYWIRERGKARVPIVLSKDVDGPYRTVMALVYAFHQCKKNIRLDSFLKLYKDARGIKVLLPIMPKTSILSNDCIYPEEVSHLLLKYI